MTGSHIIDESLQVSVTTIFVHEKILTLTKICYYHLVILKEILDFILRDYVEPWYSILTNDEEFTKSVRDTAQKIAINIANR